MFYVYMITNSVNGKIYIGKSANPQRRWRRHLSNITTPSVSRKNILLYHAMKKHGKDNFTLEIIDQSESEMTCLQYERQWISFYQCNVSRYGKGAGYNMTDGGEGVGGFRPTAESIEKNRLANIGRKDSDETKRRKSLVRIEMNRQRYISLGIDIPEMKKLYADGASIISLTRKFHTSKKAIRHIISGMYD